MRVYAKIGTGPGREVDLRGNYYTNPEGDPPELTGPVELGAHVSWREHDNGAWHTGIVDGVRGHGGRTLYLIQRF